MDKLSPICDLLFLGAPFHIAGLIVSLIVYSIDRMQPRWFFPNFSKELIEARKSELDSSASIVPILRAVRVVASVFSSMIGAVFSATMLPSAMSMDGSFLRLKTSAALRVKLSKIPTIHDGLFPAYANTEPVIHTEGFGVYSNSLQPSELFPGKVFEVVRVADRIRFSHLRFLLNRILIGESRPEIVSFSSGRSILPFTA